MSGKISNVKRRDQNASSSSNSSLSSSGGGDAAMSADLASFFECPVCFDYVLPPILQCQSGHLVCSSCRSKLTCCPTCRGSLGNIRNLAMEKVCCSSVDSVQHIISPVVHTEFVLFVLVTTIYSIKRYTNSNYLCTITCTLPFGLPMSI